MASGQGRGKPRLRFPKAARLTRVAEFARVRTEGRPVHGKLMMLGVLKGIDAPGHRVGIVTSRRVGNAVLRNRVRRRLREVVRAARSRLVSGLWLVVVAKANAASATLSALTEEWTQLAKRGSIFSD
ncbi:MAG: ribonuclease P protein component [Chthoniobacteraceae bacterium]